MKTLKSLFLVALLLGVVSCDNKENDSGTLPVGAAVQFESDIIGMPTVSRATNNAWSSGDQVGVYMMKEATNIILNGAKNRKYIADQAGKLSATGVDVINFPASEQAKVGFIAYHPYNAGVDNFIYKINVSDQTNQPQLDLIYSDNANSVSSDEPNVALQFVHKLSKIELNIAAGEGLTDADLENITVKIVDMNTLGDFNLALGQASNLRNPQTITTYTDANGKTSQATLIPAATAPLLVKFILNNSVTFEWRRSEPITLLEGKIHSFDVVVGSSAVEVSEGTITDWIGATSNPTEGAGTAIAPPVVDLYAVGDVYPKQGTPLGIVFEVSNAGANGKVVSLDEKQNRWGTSPKDESGDGVTLIRDLDNGLGATQAIITKRYLAGNFATDYVIFNWLYTDKNANDLAGAWYLPSKNELMSLYAAMSGLTFESVKDGWVAGGVMPNFATTAAARAAFNTKMTTAGGVQLNLTSQYWAVTEISTTAVWSIHFSTGVLQNAKAKTDTFGRARGVMKF